MSMTDGIAVVTGAGGGLGRALALELAARGCCVAALGRGEAGVEETAAMAASGGIMPVVADVADAGAVRAAFARIAQEGELRLLINNAAVYPRRDFLDEAGESFAETVAINLGGVVACTRAALDTMTQTGRGRILNVSTFADMAPLPASSAYSVSKGAGRILTHALVADLGDRFPGITIIDWMPGMLATRMGIKDGLPPEVSARWGAALALWDAPMLGGAVFEMDREVLPPRGLKARLRDALLLRRRHARVIPGA
ncbi:NAD(P)-dependent dehydrogenase (short-subunit alcohol dehydrogenase family) [Roseovarius sp. MBR-78]|jgi:NAD(P)-dependent dehydrogenase (short-subunit alcohol dehydrogenase family)|uniref:SDR family NAD(P)-dependent oxidoreductase n=1 Tax=Roseovarius sp. MBR-78 TaxID=3156460 RepID=UPI00339B6887